MTNYRSVPVEPTEEMIEAAFEGHYGKRRVRRSGGAIGVSMAVDNTDYDGATAFRRMWKAALAVSPTKPDNGDLVERIRKLILDAVTAASVEVPENFADRVAMRNEITENTVLTLQAIVNSMTDSEKASDVSAAIQRLRNIELSDGGGGYCSAVMDVYAQKPVRQLYADIRTVCSAVQTDNKKAGDSDTDTDSNDDLANTVAKIIIGPRNPVRASSYTLDELRQVNWEAATEHERDDALHAARAIISERKIKVLFDQDWLRRRMDADPDLPFEAHPAPTDGGGYYREMALRVSDETMRALLSCKDVGTGRSHLASILAALRTTPADPRPDPRNEALREARRLAEFLLGKGNPPRIDLNEFITKINTLLEKKDD